MKLGQEEVNTLKLDYQRIIKTSSMFDIARVIYDSSDGLMLHHMNHLVHSRVCFPGSQPNRRCTQIFAEGFCKMNPDSKVHGANMGPTWVLPVPDGPHDGPMNLAIREIFRFYLCDDIGSHLCPGSVRRKVTMAPVVLHRTYIRYID